MSEALHVVLTVVWNIMKSVARCLSPSFLIGKKSVDGQVALVTGGGSGIGRQLALRLAELGAQVVIWDVDLNGAEETSKMIRSKGQQARAYFCDVSDRNEVYRIAKIVKDQVGKVDILVNNAGVCMFRRFDDLSDETIEKVYGINILAHYWTCKAFLPDMVQDNSGHILAVSSAASILNSPNLTEYCPTKHAVTSFMQCLRMELIIQGSKGVRVTTACPLFVRTPLFSAKLPSWMPCHEAEDCARDIIDGMLRNKDTVTIPTILGFLRGFQNLFSPGYTASLYAQRAVYRAFSSVKTKGVSHVQAFKMAAKTTLTK